MKSVRGKPAALIAFLPGLSVRRPTVAQCREAGRGLAWLHVAAAGFPGRRANDLGQGAWAPMTARLAAAADALKPGLAGAVAADAAALADRWPAGLPEGIVHADYFPDNVFFREGRFAGTIDFYFAAWDALAYDIGVALNAWCFEADGSFNITAARGLHRGLRAPARALGAGKGGPAGPRPRGGAALLPHSPDRLGRDAGGRAGPAQGSAGVRAQAGGSPGRA